MKLLRVMTGSPCMSRANKIDPAFRQATTGGALKRDVW